MSVCVCVCVCAAPEITYYYAIMSYFCPPLRCSRAEESSLNGVESV